MTSINTNVGAVVAAANMATANREIDKAVERLSSGLRINSAKDDAAGMAIMSKMESQITGLNQAVRNATDAQKLIDTTEGGHVEINNILQRLRELAVQSSNDTNTTLDRTFLKAESTQLIAEIDRISAQTTWNGSKIMDGSFTTKQFQLGANANETVSVTVDDASSATIGSYQISGVADTQATNGNDETTVIVSGHIGSATATFTAADSVKDVAAAINLDTASTGVTATAVTNARMLSLSVAGTVTFTLTGDAGTAISVAVTDVADLRGIRDAINASSGTTGITSTVGSTNAELYLTHSEGEDIAVSAYTNSGHATATLVLEGRDYSNSTNVGGATTMTEGGTITATAIGAYQLDSIKAFSVVAGGTDMIAAASTTATLSAISGINIGTTTGAAAAITAIDGAIGKINASRSDLGAISNRLDSTISNLTNIITNTESSVSNIRDADFSKETSNLTRAQILNQAATSMLAQANASKQSVLALLQG